MEELSGAERDRSSIDGTKGGSLKKLADGLKRNLRPAMKSHRRPRNDGSKGVSPRERSLERIIRSATVFRGILTGSFTSKKKPIVTSGIDIRSQTDFADASLASLQVNESTREID